MKSKIPKTNLEKSLKLGDSHFKFVNLTPFMKMLELNTLKTFLDGIKLKQHKKDKAGNIIYRFNIDLCNFIC